MQRPKIKPEHAMRRKRDKMPPVVEQVAIPGFGNMSMEDVRVLSDRLALLLATDTKRQEFSRLEQETWFTFGELLRTATPGSMKTIIAGFGRKNYTEKCEFLDSYIEEASTHVLRVQERDAVRKAVLGSLINWMRDAGIAVSPTSLLNSLHLLPEAVECDFPGYAAAGLLPRIACARMAA